MANSTDAANAAMEAALAYQQAHYGEDMGPTLNAITGVCIGIILVSIGLRLYAQHMIGKAMYADSLLIIVTGTVAQFTPSRTVWGSTK
ncbi:hypothetical protein G7Y89_g1273 [Cudoniella acicularis]|uniref:Uncharacterized protein n=1 Tax=Cudoniella acicularis TaxID=354080 RepID=A0A8H4W9P6_9HELO|nr:hypothetical protein G7Y89_g1273 [Cudoniella acicularis]